VDKDNEVPDVDLEDTRTSLASPENMAASEERCVVQVNDPPAPSLHNHCRVQVGGGGAPPEYDVLENGMHGVHEEVSAPVHGHRTINTQDPARAYVQEATSHPIASSRTWELFKLPAALPPRVVCTEPIHSPTLPTPSSSPRAEASAMVPSDDELLCARIYAFKGKHASLASEVALSQDNATV
jgi:hypothetical protein